MISFPLMALINADAFSDSPGRSSFLGLLTGGHGIAEGSRKKDGRACGTECDGQKPARSRARIPFVHLLIHLFINVHARIAQNRRIYKVLLLLEENVGILISVGEHIDGAQVMDRGVAQKQARSLRSLDSREP